MGKPTGFMEYPRENIPERPPTERLRDWREFKAHPEEDRLRIQGARCMDCGTPYCHTGMILSGLASGCPVNNLIPEFNDLVYRGLWKEALDRLLKTNNFPEFTGRVCPAPCEHSCVLGVIKPPVTIKNIERAIIDKAWEEGWMRPRPPRRRTGKKAAVVGSGPAGLACADLLNRAGHQVTVFERADRFGGLLMYGIPNMKLDKKAVVERRTELMAREGVQFTANTEAGRDYPADKLLKEFDAAVLCGGAALARDLPIEGRNLAGIHFAMDYLTGVTKTLLDHNFDDTRPPLDAGGKDVVVIGGGDTGTDCVAAALRQGCKSITQLEILPRPPDERAPGNPWPEWEKTYKLDYGQEEAARRFGADPRQFQVMTKRFLDDGQGNVRALETINIEWAEDDAGRLAPRETPGTERELPAQMVLLALGFSGPEKLLIEQLDLETDARGNVRAAHGGYATNVPGIFTAGDMRRGQSLVVWAIHDGRGAAKACHRFLTGE